MRIIDITMPLGPRTPRYPGDPPIVFETLSDADGSASFAISRLSLGSHSGTHVDAPAHLIPGGATVDALDLSACIGPAWVIDLPGTGAIGVGELRALPPETVRLLLRSGGPAPGGRTLSEEAARHLVERGVRLVGIDGLSVAPEDAPAAVHRILLAAGVVILEGLDLRDAPLSAATLICLPLKLSGLDGAPARAVLLSEH